MDSNIVELSKQLITAVQAALDNTPDKEHRRLADEFCESFKETSPYAIQCGLYLSDRKNPPLARNFGLQLIEHTIKYRWNDLTIEEKVFIKDNSMKLLAGGTNSISVEYIYIKNTLSKVLVEMVKREWPQQWPGLIGELKELCKLGETQSELVVLIFSRLVEDIVEFQNLQTQRRREIYHGIMANLSEIFGLFLDLLRTHASKFVSITNAGDPALLQEADCNCRVAHTVLQTLSAFVEWVPIAHIMANDGLLLQTLCSLLSNQQLQLAACECLLQIVNRKGKTDERKPLLILFDEEPMLTIFNAARTTSNAATDDRVYRFLKGLCQVLTALGSQLCILWGSVDGVTKPQHFQIYLRAIIEFSQHPSHAISHFTQSLWHAFFRHKIIKEEPDLQSFIPQLAETSWTKLMKVGFPSRGDSLSCDFSKLDFDSDEEFNHFFSTFRSEIAETLRLITAVAPDLMFEFAAGRLRAQLAEPVDIGGSDNGLCNLSSPSFLRWDALCIYLESVLGRIFQLDKTQLHANVGIELLTAVVAYKTEDPLILSSTLSCISALFIFLTVNRASLPAVLEKLFSSLVFSLPGQTKGNRTRAVQNVRRHACSSLVNLCKQYSDLLLPVFDNVYRHFQCLSTDTEQLSQMEKCTSLEALILISNRHHHFAKQSMFLEEITLPIRLYWLSEECQTACSSAEHMMNYIGLDRAPVEPSADDATGINRSQLINCINTMLAIIKRSTWPENIDVAKDRGFMNTAVSGMNIHRNPATSHILPLIPSVLTLIRIYNYLWSPDGQVKVHPEYRAAYDILDADKNTILGIRPPCVDNTSESPNHKNPILRMQNFITMLHENCNHVIGNAGPCLGYEFYAMPHLADYVINGSLDGLEFLPDYRLRPVIRVYLKLFIQHCPVDFHTSIVIPVLTKLCPFMYERLFNKWSKLQQKYGHGSADDQENPEIAEILEEQCVRQLTRDFLDLLAVTLYEPRGGTLNDVTAESMDDDSAQQQSSQQQNVPQCSDLGTAILKVPEISSAVTRYCFHALTWNDGVACVRSGRLCSVISRQLILGGMVRAEDAREMIAYVVWGLQVHGQHDASLSYLLQLGCQLYESMRPLYPEVANVLVDLTSCLPEDVKNLDEKILHSTPTKQFPEKKKKEMFKKIVSKNIGKNVGQLFAKTVHIRNLPPMRPIEKSENSNIFESENSNVVGLCDLFSDRKTDNFNS